MSNEYEHNLERSREKEVAEEQVRAFLRIMERDYDVDVYEVARLFGRLQKRAEKGQTYGQFAAKALIGALMAAAVAGFFSVVVWAFNHAIADLAHRIGPR